MSTEPAWLKTADEYVDGIHADIVDAGYDLPQDVADAANVLAEVVGAPSVEWAANRGPKIVATCCLYVADCAIRDGDRLTQDELADASPITSVTIRNHYHDIPEVFLENADQSTRNRLGDPFVTTIEMYRDAERAGIGMAKIDPDAHDPAAFADLAESMAAVRALD